MIEEQWPEATIRSFGLPTRPDGGFRRNLSGGVGAWRDSPLVTDNGVAALESFLDPARLSRDPDRGVAFEYPVPLGASNAPGEGDWVRSLVPLLTEMKIYIGLFNEGRDGAHRLRYHAGFQLWNPYGFPLDAFNRLYNREDSRGNGVFVINATGLPDLRVSNLDGSGNPKASFTVSMDPFPEIKNSNTKNNPNETGLTTLLDLETSRFNRRTRGYLEPGEVYHLMDPDEDTEADGHSRLLTNTGFNTWWFENA